MVALRSVSARPELLVDDRGNRIVDPAGAGPTRPGPLGRNRLVAALPLNKSGHSPLLIQPWRGLVDDRGLLIGDAAGNVIGTPALWIHRSIAATKSPQTRR